MSGILTRASGYKDDEMNLPVADVATAAPFYETVLGFHVISRDEKSVTLGRDKVQMRLVENGGDPTQDGCAFHVKNIAELFDEFQRNGLNKKMSDFDTEHRDGATWKVFFVVAPDGLCYWFGERH